MLKIILELLNITIIPVEQIFLQWKNGDDIFDRRQSNKIISEIPPVHKTVREFINRFFKRYFTRLHFWTLRSLIGRWTAIKAFKIRMAKKPSLRTLLSKFYLASRSTAELCPS